jgi:SAM-dependent methyltransferase
MNWKLKAHALAVLSRIPGGRRVYHRLQGWLGTNRLRVDESVRRSLDVVRLIREAGGSEQGATVLEVGTGWWPFVPFVLSLAGAGRVVTFDVNPWLTERHALATYRALGGQLELIAAELGLDAARVRARYERVPPGAHGLNELLGPLGVDYRCPADARRTGLADAAVDVVCSSNVLEHVPPEVLRGIHEESFRVLRPGGVAVHRFNPQDHFSHVDRSITGVNFLRFSERQWHWYGGSGLSYHNRLRCVQHRRLLAEAGFDIRIDRVRVEEAALRAIRDGTLPLDPAFAPFSPEELAAEYMWLVGRRPAAAAPPAPCEGPACCRQGA